MSPGFDRIKRTLQGQSKYNRTFYLDQADISSKSAQAVVPLLIDAVSPSSVADIGCGIGTWLEVFIRCGVDDVVGVDGSGSRTSLLRIPPDKYFERDLVQSLKLNRQFDLVLCLEVAEHLPEAAASNFVASLTGIAPIIAFSAAVPGQGGTGHINEQWQSYWINLFADHGFEVFDVLRPRLWNDPAVAPYYAQNLFLFARPDNPVVKSAVTTLGQLGPIVDVVHPMIFERKTKHPVLVAFASILPERIKNSITRRLRRL